MDVCMTVYITRGSVEVADEVWTNIIDRRTAERLVPAVAIDRCGGGEGVTMIGRTQSDNWGETWFVTSLIVVIADFT